MSFSSFYFHPSFLSPLSLPPIYLSPFLSSFIILVVLGYRSKFRLPVQNQFPVMKQVVYVTYDHTDSRYHRWKIHIQLKEHPSLSFYWVPLWRQVHHRFVTKDLGRTHTKVTQRYRMNVTLGSVQWISTMESKESILCPYYQYVGVHQQHS